MTTPGSPVATTAPAPVIHEVRPRMLATLAERLAPGARVLSLDCFDTLLWRRTASPIDVFYALQHAPAFASIGFHARLRISSERTARELISVKRAVAEVTLADIYLAAFPELTPMQVQALEEAELAAEIDACYAYPPTVELIRAARARGLRIVIVSDTYLREPQLRQLLRATLPGDVFESIEQLFCSCEHGINKSSGLFRVVVPRLGVAPAEIVHLGDNRQADAVAPTALGISALHLQQHSEPVSEVIRLAAIGVSLIAPEFRDTAPLPSPFRGVLALAEDRADTAFSLGYLGAGPALYAFARFLIEELSELERERERDGKRVKALFLMRDAFLPLEVANAIAGREVGTAVSISRFTSFAASFRCEEDVDRYLVPFVRSGRFDDMSRQLLLSRSLADTIAKRARRAERPYDEYVAQLKKPDVLKGIFANSKAFRQRLYRYLEKRVGLERGDTLVLVDLGYSGTTQRRLAAIFEEELGVEVIGRYFIVSRTPGWEKARRGLIEPSRCHDRAIASLIAYIALLENICSMLGPSVIDYDEAGEPVFAEQLVDSAQFERMRPVQEACIRFARDADAFFRTVGRHPSREELRAASLGALARLLFFPSEPEMIQLESAQFDMNLGTKDTFKLFNRETGLEGLRRRGMFYMENNLDTLRMNYPAELRHAGLEFSLALLSQHRYGLDFTQSDLAMRREVVPILLDRAGASTATELAAKSTYDGYFALHVPVGACDYHVGVVFGARYSLVQIDCVQLIPTSALFTDHEHTSTEDLAATVVLDGMQQLEPGVFTCPTATSALLVRPKTAATKPARYVIRIVFRPLAAKSA
ncbi:MAG: hypothetical protein EXR75_10995 [Myxococcales bacterium]|nr:hypothetical protein [Myxococcales bacterium]